MASEPLIVIPACFGQKSRPLASSGGPPKHGDGLLCALDRHSRECGNPFAAQALGPRLVHAGTTDNCPLARHSRKSGKIDAKRDAVVIRRGGMAQPFAPDRHSRESGNPFAAQALGPRLVHAGTTGQCLSDRHSCVLPAGIHLGLPARELGIVQ